jgi:hypothetical protein
MRALGKYVPLDITFYIWQVLTLTILDNLALKLLVATNQQQDFEIMNFQKKFKNKLATAKLQKRKISEKCTYDYYLSSLNNFEKLPYKRLL